MVDSRYLYRRLLAGIMGFSLLWFFVQSYNAGHFGPIPLFMTVAVAVFFILHDRVIDGAGFFTEFSDTADRGSLQNVLLFGDWFEKQKDLAVVRDKNPLAGPPWLGISGVSYWVIAGFMFTSLTMHFSVSFFATAVLALWAWASPRALMWVPVQCVILFLALWVAPTHVARVVSSLTFLAFLVTYAACFSSYTSLSRRLTWSAWISSFWRPTLVFVIALLLSTYLFPDEESLLRMVQIKSHWAEQIARSPLAGRSNSAKSSPGSNGGGEGAANTQGKQNSPSGSGNGGADSGGNGGSGSGGNSSSGSGGNSSSGSGGNSSSGASQSGANGTQTKGGGAHSNSEQPKSTTQSPTQSPPQSQSQSQSQSAPQFQSQSQSQNSQQNQQPQSGSGSQPNSANSAAKGGESKTDQKGSEPQKPQAEKSKPDPEKIEHIIELVEKALKVALAVFLAWIVFSYFTRQTVEKQSSSSKRRDRKKLKAVLNEIDKTMDQK